jgi:putative RecB family exonuclease
MATYSHSKVSTFENCPYQYKLKYIDRVEVDMQTTIEAFMGDIVHRTLEKLYKDKKFKKLVSKATLLKFYKDTWEKEYSEDILIVKKEFKADNYKKMGMKFVEDYYNRMKPFDQLTILGLETQDRMTLPNGDQWHVRIDKLACDSEGNYFVCDYKTNSRMKDQEEADSDRQLALYSVWVKDKFTDVKSVKLVWHMLAFDKDAISERTDEQAKKLQEEVIQLIKEIQKAEEEDNFPRKQSSLCDYCGYKIQCPSFKHLAEIEELPIKKFKEEEGVKFVDEFAEVKKQLTELQEKQDELRLNLIEFAKQRGVDVVYGSNMKCSVKEFEKIVLPEEKEALIQLMKDKGLWDELAMINFMRLQSKFLKGDLHEDVAGMIERVRDFRLSLGKRKDVEDD